MDETLLQGHAPQEGIQVASDSVSVTQIYKPLESKGKIMERHHVVKKEDDGQAEKH